MNEKELADLDKRCAIRKLIPRIPVDRSHPKFKEWTT